MSFIHCPSAIKIPVIPNMTPSDLWSGAGNDAGVIAFASGATPIGARLITTGEVCYRFSVSGWSDFLPVYGVCNGYLYWYSESGRWLYYSSGKWVIHNRFPGYIPSATLDDSTNKYSGDAWYETDSLPFGDNATATFSPKGTFLNDSGITGKLLTFQFPRWIAASTYGEYVIAGGQTGASPRIMGIARWIDDKGAYYLRSIGKTGDYYTYGEIHYDNSTAHWVIGTPGDAAGWYVGNEPVISGSVVFVSTLPEGSKLSPKENLTISFSDYVMGEEKSTVWLGEAAIWRS